MAFDFDEEEDMYKRYTGGRQVTADASGVVTSVQQVDESQKDENKTEFFSEGGESTQSEGEDENPAGDPPSDEDELNDYEKEIMGESEAGSESDLPEWMKETGDLQEESGSGEMDFEAEGQEADQNDEGEEAGDNGDPTTDQSNAEIDKAVIEQYILENRPSFPDHPLDFPDLYEKRRNQGLTWGNIARDIGMTTGQLNSKLNKYRDAVKKKMIDEGVA